MRCAVIGAGAWGTALADLLAGNGHETILWAYEPDVESRTVDWHVASLRRHLGTSGKSIETLRGEGYRWITSPP